MFTIKFCFDIVLEFCHELFMNFTLVLENALNRIKILKMLLRWQNMKNNFPFFTKPGNEDALRKFKTKVQQM
jgi:hypothetical protein